MIDIKEIFLDAFSLLTPDVNKPIIEQLTNILERVTDTNLDTNVKLLEWPERKFQNKVNEKISSVIALTHIEIATNIESVKKVLENIFSLYMKLFNCTLFTQEARNHILILENYMHSSRATFPKSPDQSEKHFRNLL